MITRAKFKVTEKTELEGGYRIKLNPIYSGSAEDQAFYKYTPYGEIIMGLIQPDTAAVFKVGTPYYIDFTEAV